MTITPISALTDEQLCLALSRFIYPHAFLVSLDWNFCGPLWEREADDYEQFLYNCQSDDEIVTNAKIDAIKNKVIEASKTPAGIARAILTMKYPNGIDLGGSQ